ncbi:putative zinc-binding protein [Roseateles koreensis]|uniref:Zinc-binding protein n=1 Tax=Roseateles koreensis TaxID=2987526 RepID=A0ABT5KU10_9BURK|nr:putative zinc-binding protein [Roseateles koreensis]MDC8786422.1 putative zinc-binding protein [Roseateles koreensis]
MSANPTVGGVAAPLPLVYSCSGCSDAAQLANHLAVRLDRAGLAEMSCIAGVGGGVPNLVRKATEAAASGRPIIALDGCVLACCRACLGQQQVQPTHHVRLHERGVRKHYHMDFDAEQADRLFEELAQQLQGFGLSGIKRPGSPPDECRASLTQFKDAR